MFVLDTNVISETFRKKPSPRVTAWIDVHDPADYWVTAISRAELLLGMLILPEGARKRLLGEFIGGFFATAMKNEVLPFGEHEADAFANLVAARRGQGRPIGEFDAQIAAIARVRGFVVVTRNTNDFVDCGVAIVNPWEDGA
jgi:predicted nucleic acid-binding protein